MCVFGKEEEMYLGQGSRLAKEIWKVQMNLRTDMSTSWFLGLEWWQHVTYQNRVCS